MDLPDSSPVVELIEAFRRSKAMFAAVSLGVFDILEDRAEDASALAQKLRVSREPLERLLDTCVGLQLLRRNGAFYEIEPVARFYLCRKSEQTLTGYILYSNDVLFRLWTHIEDAIREGTPISQVMGANYEAAVLVAGQCGFGLGATPTAIANMQAVCARYGAAPQAYVLVPVVGAFLIDIANAIVISAFVYVLPVLR